MLVGVTVIVHSYARPKMLRECLLSVAAGRPEQVIVADDGSPFDVAVVVGRALYQRVEYTIVSNPECDVETRMRVPRQGELINRALTYATQEIICDICDDDLHAPGWYDALRAEWTVNPQRELVRGTWLQFNDGDAHGEGDPECPLDERGMTAGNFAWHASLTRDRGVQWPTGQTNCLDNGFLWSCNNHGVSQFNVPLIGFAGWRREHAKANIHYSDGQNHTDAFRAVLAGGLME